MLSTFRWYLWEFLTTLWRCWEALLGKGWSDWGPDESLSG
jgi:hypothetical protein